jgi:hypothetical protein
MAAGWEGYIAKRRRGVLVYSGSDTKLRITGQPFLFIYVGQNTAVIVGITTLE